MTRRRLAPRLVAAALLVAAGSAILLDRPGLSAEYFAMTDAWRGEPVFTATRPPRLQSGLDLTRIFHSLDDFSIRWSGWLALAAPGLHQLSLVTDEAAYLRLNDEIVIEQEAGRDEPSAAGVTLAAGLHRIEIGIGQRRAPVELRVLLAAPAGDSGGAAFAADDLDADRLWAKRPGPTRRLVRRLVSGLSLLERRFLGAGLALAGLSILLLSTGAGATFERRWRDLADRASVLAGGPAALRRAVAFTILALVAVVVYRFMLRLAGSPMGFDDVRYLDLAAFRHAPRGWIVDRYVHVYLLKAWLSFSPGDALLAARAYWAAAATVTWLSLAVGVYCLGRGLQLGTLAVAFWLLSSQSILYKTAGAMWPDYTAMMLVTAAVAVVLHRLARARPPAWELHALALGALTLGAVRAKATGAVLLWLTLTFLWENGRLDLRRSRRKLAFWICGLAAAQLLVMALDARVLGDALFTTRSYAYRATGRVQLDPGDGEVLRYGWIDQVWPRIESGELRLFEFFPLALLVAGALVAAAATRQKPERLVLHLFPFAYLGALLLLQLRGTYGALPRHLFPIVPAATLLAAALFHYAGIDRLGWRQLLAPRLALPLFVVLFLVFGLVVPGVNNELRPDDLAPLAAGPEAGWSSVREFSLRALLPAALALTALAAPLAIRRRGGRVLALLTLALLLLANETADTARLHATRRPAQRTRKIVYPWAAFAAQISGGERIVVSPSLIPNSQTFFGPPVTAERVAHVFLGDRTLQLKVRNEVDTRVDLALGTEADIERWEESLPGLAGTAVREPLGRIVLVRPRLAAAEGPP